MSEDKKQPPAYKGRLDVALWKNHSEKAGKYYTLDIGGVIRVNLFENKPKEKE